MAIQIFSIELKHWEKAWLAQSRVPNIVHWLHLNELRSCNFPRVDHPLHLVFYWKYVFYLQLSLPREWGHTPKEPKRYNWPNHQATLRKSNSPSCRTGLCATPWLYCRNHTMQWPIRTLGVPRRLTTLAHRVLGKSEYAPVCHWVSLKWSERIRCCHKWQFTFRRSRTDNRWCSLRAVFQERRL